MSQTTVSAAILAGGSSRRFGSDKALAPSPLDGRPILETIVERLREISDDPFIVAPPDRRYGRFGVPVVSEATPGQGPLGGIAKALATAVHERCLVVACDLPFLNPSLLKWMMRYPFADDALVPVVPRDDADLAVPGQDQRQPLHAIYGRSCLPIVRRLLAEDHRRVGDLLDTLSVTYLVDDDLRRIDPGLRSFVNLNTAVDWREAERSVLMNNGPHGGAGTG